MKKLHFATLLLGTLILSLIAAWQGWDRLILALDEIGLSVFWLPAYSVLPLTFAVLSWNTLFRGHPIRFREAIFPAVTGLAVNWLLPAVQIGGELARWQMGVQRGQDRVEGAAAAVVDKTMQLLTQLAFTLIGLGLLVWRFSGGGMAAIIALGLVALSGFVVAIVWIQRRGFFTVLHALGGRLGRLPVEWEDQSAEMDAAILQMYRHRFVVCRCAFYRLTFRLLMVGETWLAFHLLGVPIGLVEAIILESAAQAIRVGAFFIPAGLGVQEGGLIALGVLMGLAPDACLAAGLCKRVRELAIGLPAIWWWQTDQARRLLTPKADRIGRSKC